MVQRVDDFYFFLRRIDLGRQFFKESHEIIVICVFDIQLVVSIKDGVFQLYLGFIIVLILCEQELK